MLERSLDTPEMRRLRRKVLAPARGHVLDVGVGSGMSLDAYPPTVTRITGLDRLPANDLLQQRAAALDIPFEYIQSSAEEIPCEDNTFDTVSCQLVLCTVPDIKKALREIHRVLRKDGVLLFMEHVLAEKAWIRAGQHLLTPLQRVVSCGCRLNRDTAAYIEEAGFHIEKPERQIFPGYRFAGEILIHGCATPTS